MLLRLAASDFWSTGRTGLKHVYSRNIGVASGRGLATLTLFHNSKMEHSIKILEKLEEAQSGPYPRQKNKEYPPLSFKLEIMDRNPTSEEFTDLIYLMKSSAWSIFLKQAQSISYKAHPTGAQSLSEIVEADPTAMRWPILVNYKTKEYAFDMPGVRKVLTTLVQQRDRKP